MSNVSYQEMQPIFVFSFCWRTGSTLMQRVINTSNDALIWGEPHILTDLVRSFNRLLDLSEETEWARKSITQNGWGSSWVPTIQPESECIINAERSFFYSLYGIPALKKGVTRWGFKEVRSNSAMNAQLLRMLFPKAKIVFHFREPVSTFSSLIRTDFFAQFKNPYKPMENWNQNAVQVCELLNLGFEAFLIDHETLVNDKSAINNLFEYLELEKNTDINNVLSYKTGSTSSGIKDDIGEFDLDTIHNLTSEGVLALQKLRSKKSDYIHISI